VAPPGPEGSVAPVAPACTQAWRAELRRLATPAVALLALLSYPAAPAQALSRLQPSGGAGASFLLQPGAVTDRWNTGFALSAALRWKPMPRLFVGIEVGYERQPLDEEAFTASIAPLYPNVSVSGGDLWMLPVNVIGELDLVRWGTTKPYVRGGAGVVAIGTTSFSASGPGAPQVVSDFTGAAPEETVFGALAGVGVRTPLGPGLELTIDATWHMAATTGETTSFLPVRIGLVF
jgi:outer membrane protein with beta-barrel domain